MTAPNNIPVQPKVGEVWVSSAGNEHTILYADDRCLVSIRNSNEIARFYWSKNYTGYQLGNHNTRLTHKKKKKITLYMGWNRIATGRFISSTFETKGARECAGVGYTYTAEVELEVDDV